MLTTGIPNVQLGMVRMIRRTHVHLRIPSPRPKITMERPLHNGRSPTCAAEGREEDEEDEGIGCGADRGSMLFSTLTWTLNGHG